MADKTPLMEIDFSDLEFFEPALGRGRSGSVYKALWKSKQFVVAVKRLIDNPEKEVKVLSSLSHENIIQFYGAVTVAPNYSIVTEYAERGSLFEYLRNNSINFRQICVWAKEIALGMKYLHCRTPVRVIHRDLKSMNVVISNERIAKLCDFGISKFLPHTTNMSLKGTYAWMAPEVLMEKPVTTSCDVYSYSVVLWELLTHEVPFKGLEGHRIMWLVVNDKKRPTIPSSCPQMFADLMRRCWTHDPGERPSFEQVLKVLDKMLNDVSLEKDTELFLGQKEQWKEEIDDQLETLKTMGANWRSKEDELRKPVIDSLHHSQVTPSLNSMPAPRAVPVKKKSLRVTTPELEQFIVVDVQLTGISLGAGAYGSVEEVEIPGARVAAKKLHTQLINLGSPQQVHKWVTDFVEECRLMSQLRHPHIVQFVGVAYLPGSPIPVLLMEKLQTSLDNLLETSPNIPLDVKVHLLTGTARGVVYLHSHTPPIAHRDLTARNILIDSGLTAKIADLGVARMVNIQPGQLAATMTAGPGNNLYMPPETVQEEGATRYNTSIDIFSFGVVSLFTLTQTFPKDLKPHIFVDSTTRRLVARSEIERREHYIQSMQEALGETHLLVKSTLDCMEYNPEDRPSAAEVLRRLEEVGRSVPQSTTETKLELIRQKVEHLRLLADKDQVEL